MLLDPLEEQLDLPTAPVQFRNGERGEREVVCQKDEPLVCWSMEVMNPSEFRGIQSRGCVWRV
jgi:hypothetical protein